MLDRDDRLHDAAKATWDELLRSDESVLTTNYVVLETFGLTQSRLGVEAARVLADEVLPAFRLEWITEEDHGGAIQAVLAAGRRGLSLVDWTSFVVMRRLGLRRAFAFDRDFGEQGFETLPEFPPT